ncbi:MAG: [NiFe]-hydrogenase assembly chaperone HybE [Rhodoferax sp.]|nr:[NiFe]-hydrogenase assembly chaperone HybE [Rhodoferax sp.]
MTVQVHISNPQDGVEATFFRIQQTRMADVPILNPALQVEAIDFQRWQGHWLGIVVTPWCMNLMLLPGSDAPWQSVAVNQRRFVKFPAGDFAFLGGQEDEVGDYQSCSLFSPMHQFATQPDAVMTARASLVGLLAPPPDKDATPLPTEKKPAELSRRGFLSMRKR